MKAFIGIDIGGSTTKVAGFTTEGEEIGFAKAEASEQAACMYGAFGSFLSNYHLKLTDVSGIVLTGVGSSFIKEDIYGIPTSVIPEFEAIGRGGLKVSSLKEAIVVSMGTGTAFVRAAGDGITHIGGSGIGGGTLCGLSKKMFRESDVSVISKMAAAGSVGNVDLLIEDIFCGDVPSLPSGLTASNFGKMKSGASDSDIAAALFNLVFQTVGMLSVFICRGDSIKDVVLTGYLAGLPQADQIFRLMSHLYGIRFIIPENPAFATAIGAVDLALTRSARSLSD